MYPTHALPFYLILQTSSVLALAEINTSPHITELWVTVLVGVLLGLSPTVQRLTFPLAHTVLSYPPLPKATEQRFAGFFFLLAFD